MENNREQIEFIKELFTYAEERGIPLWLENGWAIDARLGKATREHEDVDIIYPEDREAEYEAALVVMGCGDKEKTNRGFLMRKGSFMIDSKPCQKIKGIYTLGDSPDSSCLDEKEGVVDGFPVRCISWGRMYFQFLSYVREVPKESWRDKNFADLKIIEENLAAEKKVEIEEYFKKVYQ